jgi:hypothetical protein
MDCDDVNLFDLTRVPIQRVNSFKIKPPDYNYVNLLNLQCFSVKNIGPLTTSHRDLPEHSKPMQ